jgi:hypothetical protein
MSPLPSLEDVESVLRHIASLPEIEILQSQRPRYVAFDIQKRDGEGTFENLCL